MHSKALVALFLTCLPVPVLAQSWSAGDPGIARLPAPASGPASDGAQLACTGGAWSLTIPGSSGAVAMLVDGKLFPGNAEAGVIALPAPAVAALKTGARFSLNVGGTEWAFGLRGSGRAIAAAEASCPAATVAAAAPPPAPAQPPGPTTLSAPDTVEALSRVAVTHGGPVTSGDWITFALPGSAGTDYVTTAWAYAEGANPVTVAAPGIPGAYELRYLKADYTILASQPVTVTPSSTPLPDAQTLAVVLPVMTVKGGSGFQVALGTDAPRASGDYLYITPAGAPEQDYSGGFTAVLPEGPASMTAPSLPGAWELRYMQPRGDGQYRMIGRAALTVE